MMKALFNRFNRGLSKEKDSKDSTRDPPPTQEKLPQLPPLPQWPPSQRASVASSVFKPLPELSHLPSVHEDAAPSSQTQPSSPPPPAQAPPPRTTTPYSRSEDRTSSVDTIVAPRHEQDNSGRSSSRKTGFSTTTMASDLHKKVAFISPPPTPTTVDRPESTAPTPVPAPAAPPAKTTLSRFQAAHGKDPRGSTSSGASVSKTDVASTKASVKATSTRSATSPLPSRALDTASVHQSLRSGTPYSQMSNNSSRILAAASWSEGAEEDLVSNLGPRERTRQEVLWEIVASEERSAIDDPCSRP